MDMTPVAGGEMYEMWGWSCSHPGCKTSLRHRQESVLRDVASRHQLQEHPATITGQTSLLDELQGLDQQ